MNTTHNIRLTATEIGTLWATYINDSMAKCILSYFLNKVDDAEIKSVIAFALRISEEHIHELTKLFKSENFPIPQGFTDQDVNVNAKRLFADSFFLYYIKNMSTVGVVMYGTAYPMSSRADVRKFLHECIMKTTLLDQKVTEILQSKGLYIRPPYISIPDAVDFVNDQKFLSGGFFGFVEKRPLVAIEIAHLFANAQNNGLGKALLMGFSQVAQSKELRDYLVQGMEISSKHLEKFSDMLSSENLPVPMTWGSDVMDSTEAPFSDKLILFHTSILVATGTGNYGVAAAASPRMDIATEYVRLAAEIAQYALKGAKMMITNGWLEEPPKATDREQLSKV